MLSAYICRVRALRQNDRGEEWFKVNGLCEGSAWMWQSALLINVVASRNDRRISFMADAEPASGSTYTCRMLDLLLRAAGRSVQRRAM